MQYAVVIYLLATTVLSGLYLFDQFVRPEESPVAEQVVQGEADTSLEKYAFDVLQQTVFEPSPFTIGEEIEEEEGYRTYRAVIHTPDGNVSGLVHVPAESNSPRPFILLLRGFVDRSIYQSGIGSSRVGQELAKAGYVSFSPDFLGYGESDPPSDNPMEERFQGYTTTLQILSSVKELSAALQQVDELSVEVDAERVGIWGHSNGGHIALTTLTLTSKKYPTVLWAPVSKPFPYSILYYTDEYDDGGKALRKLIAQFEVTYDVSRYSTEQFYDSIAAPIQIHQGIDDDPVPVEWSEELYADLNELEKDVDLFIYESSDHNLAPKGWSQAVARSISFYNRFLDKGDEPEDESQDEPSDESSLAL
ncbi:MAG: alpha/beta hydrolase family protein [Patescibacteria group bacterium]